MAAAPAPLARVTADRAVMLDDAVARWRHDRPGVPVDSITPAAAREFLDLLVDEAVLTEAAVRAAPAWPPADSAAHAALRDRLELAAALDRALAAVRDSVAAGDDEALGVAARARLMDRLQPVFDDSACARLARAFATRPRPSPDSSLAAQLAALSRLPRFAPADTAAVVARSRAGDVRGADVVADWLRLGIAYRPWIETADQVRDLVANRLFERALRDDAGHHDPARDPAIAAALARDADALTRRRWLEREVLDGLEPDTAQVARWWTVHAGEFARPRRARGIRLVLEDRAAAVRIAAALGDAAAAESLAARAARGGANYRFTVSAADDSALFRRAAAAGPGTVLGPFPDGGSWWVARVVAIDPPQQPALADVREQATERWYAAEAERRVHALAARLRRELRVEAAPGAAARLATALRADATHPATPPARRGGRP